MSQKPNIRRISITKGGATPHISFTGKTVSPHDPEKDEPFVPEQVTTPPARDEIRDRKDFKDRISAQVSKLGQIVQEVMACPSLRALAALDEPTLFEIGVGNGRTETVNVQRTWNNGDLPMSVVITQAGRATVNIDILLAARILKVKA